MNEDSGFFVNNSMDSNNFEETGEFKTEFFNNSMEANNSSVFSDDQIPASFDMQSFDFDMGYNYSSFMDILGCQDSTLCSDLSDLFQPPFLADVSDAAAAGAAGAQPLPPPPPPAPPADQSKVSVFSPVTTVVESSEVVNTPATPNSSSISSSFNQNVDLQKRAAIDGAEVEDPKEETKEQQPMKKKPKKEKKKEREPRFAFKTKCEADNLDDGYRWRKYGQKAVKNSPFPRSYYRCTTPLCDVKKRVERSVEDHSILVTTYEGTHIHPCPTTNSRGGASVLARPAIETPYSFRLGNTTNNNNIGVSVLGSSNAAGDGSYLTSFPFHQPQQQQQQQQSFLGGEFASTFNYNTITNTPSLFDYRDISNRLVQDQERRLLSGTSSSNPSFMDGGLLETMMTTPGMPEKPNVQN